MPENNQQEPEAPAQEAVVETEEQKLANSLAHAKTTYLYVANELDKFREPSVEMKTLSNFLRESIENKREDEAYISFLHLDIGPGMAQRLQKETSNDERYL